MLRPFTYPSIASAPLLLDDGFLFSFLQLGVFLAFVVTAVRAWRISPSRFRELITAVVFGLLLEEGDIIIFGTYSYNRHWISVGYVPIAIALTWAMIIASAMNLTDALGIPAAVTSRRGRGHGLFQWIAQASPAPIADALWAIILDLSLDAIAIRLQLWTWRIPPNQGWFGVPWGNFYSWLFVAAMFCFFTRLVRRRQATRGVAQGWLQLSVPLIAYAGLLASLVPFIAVQLTVLAGDRQNTAPLFLTTLAAFVGLTVYGIRVHDMRPREALDPWLIAVRLVIHITFLGATIITGIYLQLPVLLWVAILMLSTELALTASLKRFSWGLSGTNRVSSGGGSEAE